MLMKIHQRKISMADRIHVINPGNYIGLHTEDEIHWAEIRLGKAITYYDTSECPDWYPENYKWRVK